MHSLCQFDKIKLLMKGKKIIAILLSLSSLFIPTAALQAEDTKIHPDIRNYDVHVETRPMPSHECYSRTPEEWVRAYIGYNELKNQQMKFPVDLFHMGSQLMITVDRLSQKVISDNFQTAMDEKGNEPTWAGSICYYQNDVPHQIISEELIVAEEPVTNVNQQARHANAYLASIIGNFTLPSTNGTYTTQKKALVVDPHLQSPCPAKRPGVDLDAANDKGKGQNFFGGAWEDIKVAAACATDPSCQCVETAMYIRTDSTISYDTSAMCQGPGCIESDVKQVDPQSQATVPEMQGGGWMVFLFRYGGIMPIISEMVKQLFHDITGQVADQTTENRVNDQTAPASYYTTKAEEVGWKYSNCNLLPHVFRPDHPECNTSWLTNLVQSITYQMKDTGQTASGQDAPLPTSNPTP